MLQKNILRAIPIALEFYMTTGSASDAEAVKKVAISSMNCRHRTGHLMTLPFWMQREGRTRRPLRSSTGMITLKTAEDPYSAEWVVITA
jgi:hypothetical protein